MGKLAGWALLISGVMCAAANAAVLQVTNGVLTGATGVIVNGQSYDVSFTEGSCFNLFSGCDSNADFVVPPLAVGAASLALLDQVFIDGVDGEFDSDSRLTNGCTLNSVSFCAVLTPFFLTAAGDVQVSAAVNVNVGFPFATDAVEGQIIPITFDTGSDGREGSLSVWAVWSPSAVAQVPEPETLALLFCGLGLLGFHARRGTLRKAPLLTTR